MNYENKVFATIPYRKDALERIIRILSHHSITVANKFHINHFTGCAHKGKKSIIPWPANYVEGSGRTLESIIEEHISVGQQILWEAVSAKRVSSFRQGIESQK